VADLETARSSDLTVIPAPLSAPVVPESPAPADEDEEPEEGVMSLVDHLSELRRRFAVALVAVALCSVIGFLLSPYAIQILKAPVPGPLRFSELGGAFFTQLKIAVVIGVGLAMPVLMYEVWGFIVPGLTKEERRVARPWVPLSAVFFLLGCAVAYFVLPYAAGFLLSFEIPGVLEPLITAEAYFGFVTTMFLAFGLVMQFPIVIVLLAKAGIVTLERLRRGRRYVLLIFAVLAVFITPGGDPVSPTVLIVVMYLLYEFSILLVRWTGGGGG
jgi:sec-independent protein translocase protein TatC